jgi:hypothetical protein
MVSPLEDYQAFLWRQAAQDSLQGSAAGAVAGWAKRRFLRLLVIAPTPYRKSQSRKLYYRDPAYLLTTIPRGSAHALLQICFVAAYSALLLAGLQAFGPARGPAFAPLPKWRRKAKRPSCRDLITLLRQDMAQHPEFLRPFGLNPTPQTLAAAAAA